MSDVKGLKKTQPCRYNDQDDFEETKDLRKSALATIHRYVNARD